MAKVPGSNADVSIQTINAVNSSGLYVSNFIMSGTFNGTGPLDIGAVVLMHASNRTQRRQPSQRVCLLCACTLMLQSCSAELPAPCKLTARQNSTA